MSHFDDRGSAPLAKLPWSGLPQRWGHPWHPMSSYLGTFPAGLARSLITMLSEPRDLVLDPFSGRGTTLLECRASDRIPLASDLNPIAIALTSAKNVSIEMEDAFSRITMLESAYDPLLYVPEASVEPDDIQLIFHPRTLAQLCYLQRCLVPARTEVDTFLVGAILGIMHGSERQDGSSAYASICMPNTFSMSPDYVRRFVETKRLQRVERNVFALLREKVRRLFKGYQPLGRAGIVARADAKTIASHEAFRPHRSKVRLVLTSPPYLDVVNYARQNWIRCWFLGEGAEDIHSDLDDNLTLQGWLEFMSRALEQAIEMITPDGVIVLVIGDVARPGKATISIARELLRRIKHDQTFGYVGCLSDHLEVSVKTTRIWGDTKGRATSVDRILVLSRKQPVLRSDRLLQELEGHQVPDLSRLDATLLEQIAERLAG